MILFLPLHRLPDNHEHILLPSLPHEHLLVFQLLEFKLVLGAGGRGVTWLSLGWDAFANEAVAILLRIYQFPHSLRPQLLPIQRPHILRFQLYEGLLKCLLQFLGWRLIFLLLFFPDAFNFIKLLFKKISEWIFDLLHYPLSLSFEFNLVADVLKQLK